MFWTDEVASHCSSRWWVGVGVWWVGVLKWNGNKTQIKYTHSTNINSVYSVQTLPACENDYSEGLNK